jgi:hypothetical protein
VIEQEGQANKLLPRAQGAKFGGLDPEFDALINNFIPVCCAHIEFEEIRVSPGLRKALSRDESQQLGVGPRRQRSAA